MLQSLQKLITDKETMWPELCRLILIHRVEEVSDEQPNFEEAFGQYASSIKSIIERLSGLQANDYCTQFSYSEKVVLLQTMIDGIHDLQGFKDLLTQRVEEKTEYNKEKMEIY